MEKMGKVVKEIEYVEDTICNRCGESCKSEGLGYARSNGYYCGGYASKLGDGCEYMWDLCEECLIWLFKQFKIDPLMKDEE